MIVGKNDWSTICRGERERSERCNDVRAPDNTMMNGIALGQCDMWATRCKIDDKTARTFRKCG
jgi:hypothetical protein